MLNIDIRLKEQSVDYFDGVNTSLARKAHRPGFFEKIERTRAHTRSDTMFDSRIEVLLGFIREKL